ncbi:hypothetical protein [Acrocarpospora phusangensis]|nr:hypothetical protein [Acrocarpospora phusangensis]
MSPRLGTSRKAAPRASAGSDSRIADTAGVAVSSPAIRTVPGFHS